MLSKIIKNLQPKWNKTKDTTGSSGPSRTRNRYIELDRNATEYKSGNFKVKRVKVRVTTTVPPTTVIFITPDKPDSTLSVTDSHNADSSESVTNIQKSPTLSPNQGIELIQSPDLGHKETQDRDMTRDNAFLDILVGSDDHKSLITKETDAGIITSAILPPWYDTSSNSTDTMELTNHTLKFTKTDILDEDDDKNDQSKAKSDLDILLNLFSNSPLPSDGGDKSGYPKSETYIPEQSPEESNRKTHLKDLEEQFKPFFGTGPEEGNPSGTTGTSGTQKVSPANNAFHYGSTDGTTHIYGYYPEEDLDEGESVDQVDIEIDDNDKRRNGRNESNEEQLNNSGSHVIDIAFDPKAHPEIVIEPDDVDGEGDDAEYSDNDNYSDVIEPIAAGSDIQAHQVYAQPPKNLQSSGPSDLGGGIRRPMSDEDGDLYPAATEPKGHQSDWSSKQSGNSAVPPNEELPEEYLEEFSEELPDEDKPLEEDPKSMKDTAYSAEYPSNVQAHAMERKPILNVEESVLTKSKNDNDMTTTTTVKPRVRVYEVYSEPFKTTTQPPESAKKEEADVTLESEEFEPNSNKSGFVAPTPISFHENPFAVSNTNPDYVSRDGWRPVLYDRPSGSKNRPDAEKQQQPTVTTSNEQYFLSTSMQPPPFSSSPVLQITTPIRSPVTTPSNPKMSPPDEYEDEEGSNPASNEQWYNDQPGTGDEDNRESESKLKIKPSMQIPMPPPSNPPRVKFPVGENQPVLNRQPLLHPQHQNAQANMQNNFIDRTKYMHRPARPPILMRRKPPFNLPFSNRKRNKVQMNSNSIPNRNLPRGPYQAAGSNGPGSGPFQHPENPNVPVVRNRQDFIPNPHLTPGGHPPPGNVRWPADDNFVRRNIPPHMNRRPMG
ncbi:unnamed protein product [Allacma fusca]|uniref:Uncharacterized protein n=1 Tax=Allacma fusca TaxID=39272 RepID=A0A8J2LPW5_9HEXA|nr:unnamed protein product [Allacma fusca]